jgi:hypothetical protein
MRHKKPLRSTYRPHAKEGGSSPSDPNPREDSRPVVSRGDVGDVGHEGEIGAAGHDAHPYSDPDEDGAEPSGDSEE